MENVGQQVKSGFETFKSLFKSKEGIILIIITALFGIVVSSFLGLGKIFRFGNRSKDPDYRAGFARGKRAGMRRRPFYRRSYRRSYRRRR